LGQIENKLQDVGCERGLIKANLSPTRQTLYMDSTIYRPRESRFLTGKGRCSSISLSWSYKPNSSRICTLFTSF